MVTRACLIPLFSSSEAIYDSIYRREWDLSFVFISSINWFTIVCTSSSKAFFWERAGVFLYGVSVVFGASVVQAERASHANMKDNVRRVLVLREADSPQESKVCIVDFQILYPNQYRVKLFCLFEKGQYYPRSSSTIPLSLQGIGHLFVTCTVSHHFPAMRTISHFSAFLRAQEIASLLSGIIWNVSPVSRGIHFFTISMIRPEGSV